MDFVCWVQSEEGYEALYYAGELILSQSESMVFEDVRSVVEGKRAILLFGRCHAVGFKGFPLRLRDVRFLERGLV